MYTAMSSAKSWHNQALGQAQAKESIDAASRYGIIEAIKRHLVAGTDVNAKDKHGGTPLHRAAYKGQKEIIELLITKGANVKHSSHGTPLDWAMMEGGRLFVRFLREHGGKTVGELKAEADRIIGAAKDGDVEAVKQAIADRVDVNAKDSGGSTPLHSAAYSGEAEVSELLIAEGAKVNVMDTLGKTPLDAQRRQKLEITALLRKHSGKTGEELKAEGK